MQPRELGPLSTPQEAKPQLMVGASNAAQWFRQRLGSAIPSSVDQQLAGITRTMSFLSPTDFDNKMAQLRAAGVQELSPDAPIHQIGGITIQDKNGSASFVRVPPILPPGVGPEWTGSILRHVTAHEVFHQVQDRDLPLDFAEAAVTYYEMTYTGHRSQTTNEITVVTFDPESGNRYTKIQALIARYGEATIDAIFVGNKFSVRRTLRDTILKEFAAL